MFAKEYKPKAPRSRKRVKVPLVMQMEALECGAASLAMVMAYYGKWMTLEEVRADCGVSRDGSNAKNMINAARSYGMSAKGYRYTAEMLREKAVFPCILHWDGDHFVVLNGFKGNRVYINDPENGICVIAYDEFARRYSNVCLIVEPAEGFVKSGKKPSVWAFAKKRLKGTRAAFAFIILTTLITSLLQATQPGFARVFMDELLSGDRPEMLYPFIFILAAFSLVEITVAAINAVYLLKIQGKLAVVANAKYMWHVLRLPMTFFSQRTAGEIAQRRGYNEGIATSLMSELAPLALDFCMMIFYFVIMLNYSVKLTLIGLISIATDLLVAKIVSKKRVNTARVQMRDSGNLATATASGIEMIETIKASGSENGFFERWSGYLASLNSQQARFVKIDAYLGAIPGVVSTITGIVILILGVIMTMRGEFTVGMILAFHGFLSSFQEPTGSLISASRTVDETRTGMELVEDVLNYPADVPENVFDTEAVYDKLLGELELKDVTFGYARLGKPLIEGFNLKVKRGSSVAFVGMSGCGKSTLAKLITGLYKPWRGEILFDGKPAEQICREVITSSVAMVDQDIILFEDTVSNNIKLWDDSIENYEMILAGVDAHMHKEILMRDGGYSYKILEGGKDFSGGQRQRIEIARVLARDPTILILDEATSALDANTERDVMKSVKNRGITCIVIAHRLSTIRDCDQIIVLDQGKVVQCGTHDELYAKDGLYTQLVCGE